MVSFFQSSVSFRVIFPIHSVIRRWYQVFTPFVIVPGDFSDTFHHSTMVSFHLSLSLRIFPIHSATGRNKITKHRPERVVERLQSTTRFPRDLENFSCSGIIFRYRSGWFWRFLSSFDDGIILYTLDHRSGWFFRQPVTRRSNKITEHLQQIVKLLHSETWFSWRIQNFSDDGIFHPSSSFRVIFPIHSVIRRWYHFFTRRYRSGWFFRYIPPLEKTTN